MTEPDALTVPEAAAVLGVSPRTVYDVIKKGTFPAPTFKVGRNIRVSRAALDKLVKTGKADLTA